MSWYLSPCECLWSDAHLIYPCEAHAPAFDSFDVFPTAREMLSRIVMMYDERELKALHA